MSAVDTAMLDILCRLLRLRGPQGEKYTVRMKSRRWFHVSLRTLFVLLTLFGVWLGWQVRIVQHRLVMLEQLRESGVAYVPVRRHNGWFQGQVNWMTSGNVMVVRLQDKTRWPLLRIRTWLLGDCFVPSLGFDRRLTEADRRAIEAFPEAAIQAWP